MQSGIYIAHRYVDIRVEIFAPEIPPIDIRGLVFDKDALVAVLLRPLDRAL